MTANLGPEYRRRMQNVCVYIENNLINPLSLDELADVSCFSKFHFHRLFTAFLGETPADYILRLRLEAAANRIQSYPGRSMEAIAYESGFSSPSLFSRVFRKHFGLSPSTYRQNRKNRQAQSKNEKAMPLQNGYFSGDHFNNQESTMNITIEFREPRTVAAVTSHTGYNDSIGAAYGQLMAWMGRNGLMNQDTRLLGIPLDNPDITSAEKCRYKACATVPAGTAGDAGIEILTLTGGSYAVLHFDDHESKVNDAYSFLYHSFLPESGLVPGDSPSYELYHHQPGPDRHFVMDICIPTERG